MKTRDLFAKLFVTDHYFTIAIRKRPTESIVENPVFAPEFVVPASRQHWCADPVLVDDGEKTWLFYEAVLGDHGHIEVAQVLEDNGFRHVALTKGSGDQGVDILAERGGKTYAIQCKNYEGTVGNFAVQEAYTGAQFYGCEYAAVICPGQFTRGAKELAQSTGVLLWDGKKLSHMMKVSGRRPRHRN